ncbi:MAG: Ribonuclease BN [uncultured Adhaeribacter sp.]|uniref:Ribonuclease BN n=1 Tax=uncultured Adhaeribacter sp. TaxID=448109 RepID=A0A6J4JMH5_9BACT|nr:MAG: Ribonuclease BN [uncultured Adhaeribacter sp.]
MAKYTTADVLSIGKHSVSEFMENNSFRLAAALSYNTIFALPPLLLIIITAASTFLGEVDWSGKLGTQIEGMIGQDGAKQVQEMVKNINRNNAKGIMGAVGIGALIFTATTFFITLQDALNTVWNIKLRPTSGIMKVVKDRFLSFGLIISISLLMLISFIVSAALTALMDILKQIFPDVTVILMQIVDFAFSTGFITCLFALTFKFLPDAIIRWKDVWVGSFLTALLFVIGKYLIGFYLGNSDVASAYGAAGSVIILLVWIYYSSLIIFFGAEFTQEYANRFGEKIRPKSHAMAVEVREITHDDSTDKQAGRPPAEGRFRKD